MLLEVLAQRSRSYCKFPFLIALSFAGSFYGGGPRRSECIRASIVEVLNKLEEHEICLYTFLQSNRRQLFSWRMESQLAAWL